MTCNIPSLILSDEGYSLPPPPPPHDTTRGAEPNATLRRSKRVPDTARQGPRGGDILAASEPSPQQQWQAYKVRSLISFF